MLTSYDAVIILNFAHPFTLEHLKQMEGLTNQKVDRTIELPTALDP